MLTYADVYDCMEDTHFVHHNLNVWVDTAGGVSRSGGGGGGGGGGGHLMHMFGVFDGHGGSAAAEHCQNR